MSQLISHALALSDSPSRLPMIEDELTLANCPDPAGLYINADIKPARRRQIKYLTDVGVYNDQGDVVHPDELPVVLAPGTAVLVNANLRLYVHRVVLSSLQVTHNTIISASISLAPALIRCTGMRLRLSAPQKLTLNSPSLRPSIPTLTLLCRAPLRNMIATTAISSQARSVVLP